ncbi:hypothetical protein C0J52_21479 [Blattella germanica]|nr:hypothetical protein C0J52_21479 [Blattella germanica]
MNASHVKRWRTDNRNKVLCEQLSRCFQKRNNGVGLRLNVPGLVQLEIAIKVFKRLAGNLHCLREQWHCGQTPSTTDVKVVADLRRPGRTGVSEEEMHALATLLDIDLCHTIREPRKSDYRILMCFPF